MVNSAPSKVGGSGGGLLRGYIQSRHNKVMLSSEGLVHWALPVNRENILPELSCSDSFPTNELLIKNKTQLSRSGKENGA